MSPEIPEVHLEGPAMVPLVRAAATLAAQDLPPYAIIGGVAVAARLGRPLRATRDVDAVTDYRAQPSALEVLGSSTVAAGTRSDDHTLVIAGAEVQFQDVAPVTDGDLQGLDRRHVLYVGGHALALTAAAPMRLIAADGGEAVVPIAPAGALVATKLHAYLDRRGPGQEKKPGDLWDLYNLLSFTVGQAATDLAGALPTLRRVLADTIAAELVENAHRARTVLRGSNDERYQAIQAEELAYVARQLLERLDL